MSAAEAASTAPADAINPPTPDTVAPTLPPVDATTGAPKAREGPSAPEPVVSPEAVRERRLGEMGQVASSLFRGRLIGEDGQRLSAAAINMDPVARRINYSDALGNLDAEALLSGPRVFPEKPGTDKGEPVFVTLASGERVKLLQIIGVDGKDDLTCEYETVIETATGPTSRFDKGPVARRAIVQGNIVSERATIVAGFSGDEQAVVSAYIDSLDPTVTDPSLPTDGQIEAAAKGRMLTTDDVRTLITNVLPDESKRPVEAQRLLNSLEGKLLLTPKDFREAMSLMGASKESFATRSDALSAEIKRLSGILSTDKSNDSAKTRLEEAYAEQAIIGTAYELFAQAEKDGKNPLDDCFEKIQNGELSPTQTEAFIQAFREGNPDGLINFIMEQRAKDIPEDQQEAVRSKLRKMLTGGLYVGAAPLGIAGLVAVLIAGVVVAGTQLATAGGGRR